MLVYNAGLETVVIDRDFYHRGIVLTNCNLCRKNSPEFEHIYQNIDSYYLTELWVTLFKSMITYTNVLPELEEDIYNTKETIYYPYLAFLPLKEIFKRNKVVVTIEEFDEHYVIVLFSDRQTVLGNRIESKKFDIKERLKTILATHEVYDNYEVINLGKKKKRQPVIISKLGTYDDYQDMLKLRSGMFRVMFFVLLANLLMFGKMGYDIYMVKFLNKEYSKLFTENMKEKNKVEEIKKTIGNVDFVVNLMETERTLNLLKRLPLHIEILSHEKNTKTITFSYQYYYDLSDELKQLITNIDINKMEVSLGLDNPLGISISQSQGGAFTKEGHKEVTFNRK